MAGDHVPQLGFMRDRSPFIHVMCARQSGKTWGDDGILLGNALAEPESTNIFLGLKGTGVKLGNWVPVWKRLCARFNIPERWHNETDKLTTFPNGARVLFGGTDDLENVRKFLGNRLHHGVFIVDEAQDQKDDVLRYILRTLLPPMLTPTTRVILSGVLPDVEAGLFYELSTSPGWSHHEWGRAANVHTPEAMAQLREYMRLHGLAEDDPQIQRDWYMKRVWDAGATAYRYERSKAGYDGNAPAWLDRFSVGIDPGTRDRCAIQVWGWGVQDRNIYHVHEWVTERNADAKWSDVAAELGRINERWKPAHWYYDAGGSQMTLDTFLRDYGVPVVAAAKKSDLAGQVGRMADLLALGRAKVRIGSALETDLLRARWDQDARAKGLYRWSSAWHPDAADAARYALAGYWDSYVQPKPKPTQDPWEQEAARDEELSRLPYFKRRQRELSR
ncbi:MAG TPA: hypothetical protein VMS92_21715 [Mycobacterium sp.]|nr:hypothetical protein [Mycobacterium sp.]